MRGVPVEENGGCAKFDGHKADAQRHRVLDEFSNVVLLGLVRAAGACEALEILDGEGMPQGG